MGENSKIEWCDHTFNPWRGCTKVSPGCANCYAEKLSKRNPAVLGQWGPGKPRVLASEAAWKQPLRWAREAREKGVRPRVFCASLADWLDDEVPVEWLGRLLKLIHDTPELDWLLLTKRPGNFEDRMDAVCWWSYTAHARSPAFINWLTAWHCPIHVEEEEGTGTPPHNVWVGTTVEDQPRANERIPMLLQIPARVRFLSCEPLLGPVNLDRHFWDKGMDRFWPKKREWRIDWVICGGESGPGARPMHPDWARGLRDQCVEAGVPFFFKQWGEFRPAEDEDFENPKTRLHWVGLNGGGREDPEAECLRSMVKVGKKAAGRVLEGLTWDESPRYEVV